MSDKTLADKMYLKTAKSLAVVNGAVHPGLVARLPQELVMESPGEGEADAVLLFALNQKQLDEFFPEALNRLGEMGSLWVAFLKPTAPKATDINRDTIYAFAKEKGAMGVALVSMDGDWSAVRLKRM
jgi:hypothetical protein